MMYVMPVMSHVTATVVSNLTHAEAVHIGMSTNAFTI